MVLTNDDLHALSGLLDEKLQPIKDDISELKIRVTNLEIDVRGLKQEVSVLKAEVADLKERVANLEQDVSVLKQNVRILKLDNENVIKPSIQMLTENYVPAARQYELQSEKINELKSDVDVMKIVVKEHSEQIEKLQKLA